jgi:hypothetical protein
MYDGPALDGEIRAYRGSRGRPGGRAARVNAGTSYRATAATPYRVNAAARRRPPAGRDVMVAGGAAALTVGKAMVDVARPAAAAAAPMLRVVAGGLDRVPTASVARPAARGRILIVVAGLLAAGLIYINVGKLEAGDGYGRYAQRALELQRDNTILRGNVARLSSSERIVRRARTLGMVMPQPEQFKYLHTRRGDALKAVRTYTAPTTTPVAVSPQQTLTAPPLSTPTTPTAVVEPPANGAAPATTPQQTPVAAPAAGRPPPTTPGAATPGMTNGTAGAAAPGGR